MTQGAVRTFRPKSKVLQVGAVTGCVVALLSGGVPLALLCGLVAVLYLTGGKSVDVDCDAGRVRTRWSLAGLQLSASDTPMRIRRVELRPEWMARASGDGHVDRKGSMVYDLVLVGAPPGDGEEEVVVALKEDQFFFGRSERYARDVAGALGLPLAVRWDRLFGDIPPAERRLGEWLDPIVYPSELGDWRRWL